MDHSESSVPRFNDREEVIAALDNVGWEALGPLADPGIFAGEYRGEYCGGDAVEPGSTILAAPRATGEPDSPALHTVRLDNEVLITGGIALYARPQVWRGEPGQCRCFLLLDESDWEVGCWIDHIPSPERAAQMLDEIRKPKPTRRERRHLNKTRKRRFT